jgi:hypothetical protein
MGTTQDNKTYVYAFLYNSCISESTWSTMSLHLTIEGAEKAMNKHKQDSLDDFNLWADIDNGLVFGEDKDWCVEKIEVIE